MTALLLTQLEQVFSWLLSASWQAAVLAVVVLLLQLVLRGRLNPRWRYALWLLVIVRLLLPLEPESAWSLFQFAPQPSPSLTAPVTEPLFAQVPLSGNTQESSKVQLHTSAFSLFSLLAILWLTGVIALSLLTWQVNRRFTRQVAASPEMEEAGLLHLFADAKTELGIRRPIRLIESAHLQSPAIMGLFHPTLLLPTQVRDKFDATELRLIFLHELAHLKRGDILVQGLIALLQILHWFNPVLWFAFRRMRADREPATDALVLSRTGEAEKERYGLMLIKLLEHFNQRHSLPTLVGILEDKDQFKRRFSLIAKFTRGAYGWSLLGVFVIAILAIACLTKAKAAPENYKSVVNSTSPAPRGVKSQVQLSFTLVQVDEKTYEQNAAAMDEAVRKGDVHFFDGKVLRTSQLFLLTGQSGWFSEGESTSYITSVTNEMKDGKPYSLAHTEAVFTGFNIDFKWTPDNTGLDTTYTLSRPVGYKKVALDHDVPGIPNPVLIPQIQRTTYTDKGWTMEPGKEHGFWAGMAQCDLKLFVKRGIKTDDLINAKSDYRLAVFINAQPQETPASTPATAPQPASTLPAHSKEMIKIGLKVVEVSDDEYQKNKKEIDAAVERADIGYFNNRKGVSMLSSPSVTTKLGQKDQLSIVRKSHYLTSLENARTVSTGAGQKQIAPPPPTELATKEVGINAEFTPSIDDGNSPTHGKILLAGKFSLTSFDGLTPSNVVAYTPSFTTHESIFLEALEDNQLKGIWIPGGEFEEPTITDTSSGNPATAQNIGKKRLLVFFSAARVK